MTEKIPPLENGETLENVNLESGRESVALSQEAMEELAKEDLDNKFRQSETHRIIQDALAKKETGAEPLNEKGTVYTGTTQSKPSNRFRNTLMAFRLGLAGLLGLGATKASAGINPADSTTERKSKIENVGGIEVKAGLKIRELTNAERVDWNNFIDFVESKGLKGSDKLGKGSENLAKSLFAEYKKLNPTTTVNYDIVPSVQYEMQVLRQNVQGFEERHKNPNAKNLMNYISPVDAWFGPQTSESKYFNVTLNQYHNDNLVSSEDLGLANSRLEPEKMARIMKNVPKGAKVEQLADGYYYENSDGDLVRILDK